MIIRKIHKILALVLCGVMILNGGITVLANTVSSGDAMPVEIMGVEVNQQEEDTVSSGDVLPEKTLKEISWSDDEITVKVTADEAVIGDVESIEVTPIVEDDAWYAQIAEQLEDVAATDAKSALGFYAYDITFWDTEKAEIYPEGEMKLTVEYADPIIPAAATENVEVIDVALIDLDVDKEGVVTATEVNGILSTEGTAVKSVVYTADNLERFALAWSGDKLRTLSYDDEEINIELTSTEYVLQGVVDLRVTPIKAENEETQEQYAQVAHQLEDKVAADNEANDEQKEVVGFLAYDITLMDADGNKIEPSGNVRVTMEYKEAAIPEAVAAVESIENTEVTVMHHVENANGVVEEVVDMVAEEAIEAAVTTTEEVRVENAEFVTDSFSVFTITWVREGTPTFEFNTQIYYGHLINNKYEGFVSDPFGNNVVTIKSVGTPPTLYMDTIAVDGDNAEIYSLTDDSGTYFFAQAYVATVNADGTYNLANTTPIIAVQAKEENVIRYMLRDAGVYQTLTTEQVIFFVYVKQESAVAQYYKEDGTLLNDIQYTYADKTIYTTSEQGVKVNALDALPDDTGINTTIDVSGISYKYAYTMLDVAGEEITPTYIRYKEGILQYRTSENAIANEDDWIAIGAAEIKLVYIVNTAIATLDTAGLIDINLYDYVNHSEFGSLEFVSLGQYGSDSWNDWNSNDSSLGNGKWAVQGIVKNQLYDVYGNQVDAEANYQGYPVMAVGDANSLKEMFGGNANSKVTPYEGLNHFFKMDENNYYMYDSAANEAYYDSANGNKNFIIYENPNDYAWLQNKTGQFMPLARWYGYSYSENWDSDDTRYHFGMNIGFNFTQPKEGILSNGDVMTFEFSGDDDVWVFIDGQLVLDIGGIHGKVTGKIDFSTGEVTITPGAGAVSGTSTNTTGASTTLGKIFGLGENVDTFEDGTTHRLEFFYLERGMNEANCKLKFNIPPQYPNNIEIEKEITNTDKQKYANVEFDFKLYLEDERNSGDLGSYDLIPQGTPYTLKKDGEIVGIGRVKENGIFTLKHGETAVFSNIHPGIRYYVEEISVNSTEFDKVMVNDEEATYYDQAGNKIEDKTTDGEDENEETVLPGSKEYIARTSELLAGEVGKVLFENRCSTANKRELIITKEVSGGGTADENDTFGFKIYLSADGELVPYEGEYYILEDGEVINNEQPFKTDASNPGVVTGIKAGQSIVITDVLSGTEFKVEELELDATIKDKYAEEYTKSFENVETNAEKLTITGSDGAVILNYNAKVVITNYLETTYKNVTFTKLWDDYDNYYGVRPSSITVKLIGKVGDNTVYTDTKTITVNNEGDWTYTWEGVPVYSGGEKIIWTVEEDAVENYKSEYTGNKKDNAEAKLDKHTVPNNFASYTKVADDLIPADTSAAAVAYNLRSGVLASAYSANAVALASDDGITTYAGGTNSTTYAGRPGSSSSSTFNHFDIQANGSYSFDYAGQTYTVTFDFYDYNGDGYGEWTLKDASGTKVSSGVLDVADFKITNTDTKEVISTSGSWQSSNISGQDYEFRISGSFSREHTFNIYFEIPVQIPNGDDTYTTINLISDFNTSYSDTDYNICPAGGGKGIDIKLDDAIDQSIPFNVLGLTKTFTGLEDVDAPDVTFTITGPNGYNKTIKYSDFAEEGAYTASTSFNNLEAGTYTITETVLAEVEGYYAAGTTVTVGGAAGESTIAEGNKSVTFTIAEDTVSSVTFVNNYTNIPQQHEISMQKVWVGDENITRPESVTLTAELVDVNGNELESWTATLNSGNNWKATMLVDEGVRIVSIAEVIPSKDLATNYVVTTNVTDTVAVVINTYVEPEAVKTETTTIATITKTWDDQNNKYGKRPESITIELYQKSTSGNEMLYATQEITADDNWTYTFTNLPYQKLETVEGQDPKVTETYSYSIKELTVPGYLTTSKVDVTITETSGVASGVAVINNKLDENVVDEELYIVNELQTKAVTFNKYWNDADNMYGSRPDTLTLKLMDGTKEVRKQTLSTHENANKWSVTFTFPAEEETSNYELVEEFPAAFGVSNYYDGVYDVYTTRDVNGELSIVNTPNLTSISVTKEWKDALNAYGTRPDSISFVLQYKYTTEAEDTWRAYRYDWDGSNVIDTDVDKGIFVIDGETCVDPYQPNYWFYTIDKLPITDDSGILEYRVVEITTNTDPALDLESLGYKSQSNGNMMTNSLEAQLIKQSASTSTTGEQPPLEGAIFTLSKGETVHYYGKSDVNGVINWYSNSECTTEAGVANGIYTFQEIQAPAGYMLCNEEWTLEMIDGLPAIIDIEKSQLDETKSTAENPVYTTKVYVRPEKVPVDEGEATKYVYTYYFDNKVLYELPSTGGSGMFSYVFGGIALMLGAAYVWFRNRRKEMLY